MSNYTVFKYVPNGSDNFFAQKTNQQIYTESVFDIGSVTDQLVNLGLLDKNQKISIWNAESDSFFLRSDGTGELLFYCGAV